MHRLFVPPEDLARAGGTLRLAGRAAHYLSHVLRLKPGAPVELFDGAGNTISAEVRLATAEDVQLALGARKPAQPAAADIVLVQALAKGDKLDLVVQKATELGVARIVPLAAERSVVKLDAERAASRAERWRRIAQEASRQCGRADVPRIDEPAGWDDLFGSLRAEPERRGLILDPAEPSLRLSAAARGVQKVLLTVGPEGGFSPAELERAAREGLLAVSLGPRVLRTETVALAALAVLLHLAGELG